LKTISRDEIAQLHLDIDAIAAALDEAFRAGAAQEITWKPKSMLAQPDGAFLMSTFAAWPARGLGIFHSLVGATAAAARNGSPAYRSLQLLAEHETAEPIALLDGTYTSTMLPAGVTRLMAGRLGRSRSRVATFVGAGTQARVNLAALDGILPIDEVRIVSRTTKSAAGFAEFVSARGQRARIMQNGPEAFEGADIIISTVPASPGLQPALEPRWVSPGTFVNAVDLGRSWQQGFDAFDRVVTDDRKQAEAQFGEGRLIHGGPYDSEIAEILTGARPGRLDSKERIVLIHPGNVVGILGLTRLIVERLHGTQ
jgi:ornithine cyclodeaminase/alanine dehydrogenase